MSECVNVRKCPQCGQAELCDAHEPQCVLCALSVAGVIPPASVRRESSDPARPSWFSKHVYDLMMGPTNNVRFKLVAPLVCAIRGHSWRSHAVVGHRRGPTLYYANTCYRCGHSEEGSTRRVD